MTKEKVYKNHRWQYHVAAEKCIRCGCIRVSHRKYKQDGYGPAGFIVYNYSLDGITFTDKSPECKSK